MQNNKYELTDIAHLQYPFLRRIRALRNIGDKVKAGDFGGFVESEQNLSFEPGDEAWLFDEAISCNEARVDKDSILKDNAIVSGQAYITQGAELGSNTQAMDKAYISGALLGVQARAYGSSIIVSSAKTHKAPQLRGEVTVYGKIAGDVRVSGWLVIMENECIQNNSMDALLINNGYRSIIPAEARAELKPQIARTVHRRNNVIEMAR